MVEWRLVYNEVSYGFGLVLEMSGCAGYLFLFLFIVTICKCSFRTNVERIGRDIIVRDYMDEIA